MRKVLVTLVAVSALALTPNPAMAADSATYPCNNAGGTLTPSQIAACEAADSAAAAASEAILIAKYAAEDAAKEALAIATFAAELKAKQEAEAKAVADKAAADKAKADALAAKIAADKAAANKAAALAAANKKTTITCIKGKLTKKVTAIKPMCPIGYKVKK